MKKQNLIWIVPIILILMSSFASALIDYDSDVKAFVPLFSTTNSSSGLTDISGNLKSFTAVGDAHLDASGDWFNFDGAGDYLFSGYVPPSTVVAETYSLWLQTKDLDLFAFGTYAQPDYHVFNFYANNSIKIYKEDDDNSNKEGITTGAETYRDGTFHHLVFVNGLGANNLKIYMNGVELDTSINENGNVDSQNLGDWFLGCRENAGSPDYCMEGNLTSFIVFNKLLSDDEVLSIYNRGYNYNPYTEGNNFTITTNSPSYNITMISNETLNYSNANLTQILGILTTDTREWNITLTPNQNYYTESTYTDYNFTLNGNIDMEFNASSFNVSFIAKQITTDNTSLYPFNVTLPNSTVLTVTSQTDYKEVRADTLNFTFSKAGYYDFSNYTGIILSNTTIYFNGVYNSILNLTRYLNQTGLELVNYTGWVYNAANIYNASLASAPNAYDTINLLQGLNYTIWIDSTSDYSSATTSIVPDATTEAVNLTVFSLASIYITFYDEGTSALMNTTNITLEVLKDGNYSSYTVTNGTYNLLVLSPDDYILRYSALNYAERLYYITVDDDDYYVLTLYLAPNTSTTEIQFSVTDYVDSVLESATVKALKYDNVTGNYVLTEQCDTNYLGVCYMDLYFATEFYKFQVQYDSETKLTTSPAYIDALSYAFRINTGEDYAENIFNYFDITADLSFNNATNNFRLTYNDANGLASHFCVYVYSFSRGTSTFIDSSCTETASGTVLVNVPSIVNGTLYTAYAYYDTPQEFLISASYEAPNQPVNKNLGMFLQFLLTLTIVLLTLKFSEFIPVSVGMSLVFGKLLELHALTWGVVWSIFIIGIMMMFLLKTER